MLAARRKRLTESGKRRLLALFAATSRWLFRVIPASTMQAVLKGIPWGPLNPTVYKTWLVVLRLSSHRSLLCEWLAHQTGKTGSVEIELLLIETLVASEHLQQAEKRLAALRERVYRDPELEPLAPELFEIETLVDIERDVVPQRPEWSLRGLSRLAKYSYEKLWEMHAMRMDEAVARYSRLHFACTGYQHARILHVCAKVLRVNGLWQEIVDACEQSLVEVEAEHERRAAALAADPRASEAKRQLHEEQTRRARDQLAGMIVEALVELDQTERVPDYLKLLAPNAMRLPELNLHLALAVARYRVAIGEVDEAIALLTETLGRTRGAIPQNRREILGEIAGDLAILHEERADDTTALHYYRRAVHLSRVPGYLPSYVWRFISMQMARDEWGEALHVLRLGHRRITRNFEPVARRKFFKRIMHSEGLPKKGALFLGGWGLGDEIIRVRILQDAMHERGRYAYVVDPRMRDLFGRSFPAIEFLSSSRAVGPAAVDIGTYLEARSGVPEGVDRARVDNRIYAKIREYPDVALSEDLILHYVQTCGATVTRHEEPMLKPRKDLIAKARDWVGRLPEAPTVGIAWRSGKRNISRNRSYSELNQWREILTVRDVNFVSLQHSDTTEELAEAAELFGCHVHQMPDLDLKDDIEGVAALATTLDLVIAPSTTVRDLSASCGATAWSLTSTKRWVDLWRLDEDGETDRLFPTLSHITSMRYGDLADVLAETGRRLRDWSEQRRFAA